MFEVIINQKQTLEYEKSFIDNFRNGYHCRVAVLQGWAGYIFNNFETGIRHQNLHKDARGVVDFFGIRLGYSFYLQE